MPGTLPCYGLGRPDALPAQKPAMRADALPVEKPVMPVALRAADHAKPDALPAGVEKPVMPVALRVAEPADALSAEKPVARADALPVEKPVMPVALRAADHAKPDALPASVEKPVMPVALRVAEPAKPDALSARVPGTPGRWEPGQPEALPVAEPGSCQLFDASSVPAETSKRSTCPPHLQVVAAYWRWLWP